MRTIIAMTGASGSAFGVSFLKKCPGEKVLVVSKWGKSVLHQETGLTVQDLSSHADYVVSPDDMNAPFASGSNSFDQFVVLPCSVATLGRMASGVGENLISRIGEIALKENRRMVLCLRETPLSAIALENCLKLARLGVTVMPIMPAFYLKPGTVERMADDFADHLLTTLRLSERPGWRADRLSR